MSGAGVVMFRSEGEIEGVIGMLTPILYLFITKKGKGGNRPMGPQDHAEGAEESSSSLFTVSP
jgi:hypothetical protein